MSGIGISFGLDRLFLVIDELKLFPAISYNSVRVLILNFGASFSYDLIEIANFLRLNEINAEFYPDPIPVKKQLNYANKNDIPYVIFYGDEEKEKNFYKLKDMKTGNQKTLSREKLVKTLRGN